MSDAYDWPDDAARCYVLAIETMRERYLAERLLGETAEQWRDRKQSRRILEKPYQNPDLKLHIAPAERL